MYSAGYLSGAGTFIREKFQIGEAIPVAGVPLEASALADVDGVMLMEQDEGLMAIGLALDAAPTRNTAQQSDGSDPAVYVTVDVRPDLIVAALLSGGQTAGTALSEFTNTVASTDGLLITASFGTAYDDGYAWGATGANAGILRKIQGAVNTTGTPIIAYPNDIAVGDTFYASTVGPGERAGVGLTTDLTQIDATDDEQDENNFRCLRLFHKPKAMRGATDTLAHLVFCEHIFRFSGTAAS